MRTWEELVEAGQKAVSGYQWELGDLAGEVETGYGESSLANYAAEVGSEYSTLKDYRAVAKAYPEKDGRPSNWSVASVFRSQDDRLDLIKKPWTVAEARALVASRKPASALPAAPEPPQGGDLDIDDLLGGDGSQGGYDAGMPNRSHDDGHDRPVAPAPLMQTPGKGGHDPVSQQISESMAITELVKALFTFAEDAGNALKYVGALGDGARMHLQQAHQQAGIVYAQVSNYLKAGVNSLDAELQEMLGEE